MVVTGYTKEADQEAEKMFVSKEAQKFTQWLEQMPGTLNCYVTNAVRCWPINDREPHVKEIKTCSSNHLWFEIVRLQPQLIVTLGKRALVGVVPVFTYTQASDRTLQIFEHEVHFKSLQWKGNIYPLIHPEYFRMATAPEFEQKCIKILTTAYKEAKNAQQ
jgi:uracil-DNA glycosylase family 4